MGIFRELWEFVTGPNTNPVMPSKEKLYKDPREMCPPPKKVNLNGVRIFMVEDEKDVFTAFKYIFEDEGCVCSGEAAAASYDLQNVTEEILRFKPQVILLDHYYLPKIKTAEVIGTLKTRIPDCPPIIIFAAGAKEAEVQRASEAGASDFLVAPFDPEKLIRCTCEVLEKQKNGTV